jgi:hypothetical protein
MNARVQETGHAPTEADRLRASHRMLVDMATRLSETHGPVATTDSADAAFFPLELHQTDNAQGTVLAFSSLQPDFPLPPREFGGSLKGSGRTVLFVKDFARVWYQKGLVGLSSTRQETVSALRDIIAGLPRPWTFIGASSGGYAALYFGAHLEADHIRAFSPQTLVDRQAFMRFSRCRPFEMGFDTGDPENDLAEQLGRFPALPPTRIYYGAPHHMDRKQALRLQDLDAVTLHEVQSRTHNIAQVLKKRGELHDALF